MHTLLLAALLTLRIGPESTDVTYTQPQLAADARLVGLTFGAGNTVYFARSEDQGKSFSPPVKVSGTGSLALGMHRGPRIAITPRAVVISAVVGQKGKGEDGDLMAWRSTDGGRTWSAGVKVNDAPGSAREGLQSIAAGDDGTLFAAWLDLRTKGTRIYGAASRDGGVSWSKNVLVYESPSGSVCECCHPNAVAGPADHVAVMFRNSLYGARDLYVAISADGGQKFEPAEKLGDGTWQLNACPMDGGDLIFTAKGDLVSIWRRENIIYLATLGAAEQPLGPGKNPVLTEGRKGLYAAWVGPSGSVVQVPGMADPLILDPKGSYVDLMHLPDGAVLAVWENQGSLAVERLP